MRFLILATVLIAMCTTVFAQQQSTDCLLQEIETYDQGVPGFTPADPDFNISVTLWPDWAKLDEMTSAELAEAYANMCCWDGKYFQVDITTPIGADPTLLDQNDDAIGDFHPTGYLMSGTPPVVVGVHWRLILDSPAEMEELDLQCNQANFYDIEAWVWDPVLLRFVEQHVYTIVIPCDDECEPLPYGNGNQPLAEENPFGDDSDFQPLVP